tara:strand:- start:274 stop:903 length:630 start_codon:yes stop_codon:yes gene_type:complete
LSAEEQSCLQSFKFSKDRQAYGVSHIALREILAAYLSVCPSSLIFKKLEHGKPVLEGYHLAFNLTHSDGVALIAVGGSDVSRVGIDIEPMGRSVDALNLAKRFFSKKEFEALRDTGMVNPQAEFMKLWVLKEAYMKAVGCGLSGGMDESHIQLDGDRPTLVSCHGRWGDASLWMMRLLQVQVGYIAGLAVPHDTDFIKYFDYPSAGVVG